MIDPNNINTVRVGQLVEAVFSGTDNIPHEVGTDLRRGTIADLATYIAGVIDSTGGLAFLPISVTDGQQLPATTTNEWFLAGEGTYSQLGGYPDIVCTEKLSVIIGNGSYWSLGVSIPITVDPPAAMISQTVNAGVTNYSPSEDAVRTAINEVTFLNAMGTFHYADLATQTVPISVTSGVETKLTNDAEGDNTNVSNAPFGVSSLWNPITNQFDFSQLSVGDVVHFRPDLSIDLIGTNTSYKLYIKMAVGGLYPWTLNVHNGERKTTDEFDETVFAGFDIGSEDVKNFPAEMYILTDAGATVTVNGWYIEVLRKNINVIDIVNNIDDTIIEDSPNAVSGGAVFDALEAIVQPDYAVVVYVNSNNPNTATIFDDVNPPTTNDDALKIDTDNLYIGTDSSYWVYNGVSYVTKTVKSTSNFYIAGTSADAGNTKSSPIERQGSIKTTGGFIKDGATSSDLMLGNGATSTLKTVNGNNLLGSGNIVISGGATNLEYTASPTNGIVTSDTGTDATIPLADGTNAGLLKPAKYTVLENTSGTNTGDQDLSGYASLATIVTEKSTSFTLTDADVGIPFVITASCTVTIPNGLMAGFNATFVTLTGVTLTVALGGSVVLHNNAGTSLLEKSSFTLQARTTTNNYITAGAL